jgi:diaminopropionate ammonia-lyase
LADFWLRSTPAPGASRVFSAAELADVTQFYQSTPDAVATPLRHFRGLAAELGIRDLLIKDESARFGLPAFKIAGARYAVARLVEQRGQAVRDLVCATAGNHGRAVAHAGRLLGLRVHVYVPAGTAAARINALRAEGAEVVITTIGYDETVRLMARDATERDWTIVSDTAWPGYEAIPREIMAGYTWLMHEAAAQWRDTPPDVVIVQAGVGSLAGAVAGWLQHFPGPRLVIAEPVGSACVQASLHAGRRVTLDRCGPTAMVGLRCAEVSTVAWPALESVVEAAIAVADSAADRAIARLARPAPGDDAAMATAASGAAGLAALLALVQDPELAPIREALEIGSTTCALILVTEGATDSWRPGL